MSKRQAGLSEFWSHSKRPRDLTDEELAFSPGLDEASEEDPVEDPTLSNSPSLSTSQR